jgi:hypothetical protein
LLALKFTRPFAPQYSHLDRFVDGGDPSFCSGPVPWSSHFRFTRTPVENSFKLMATSG